nr:IgG-binding virulence factor TspB family protein [uncultured Albidiferax sp.]
MENKNDFRNRNSICVVVVLAAVCCIPVAANAAYANLAAPPGWTQGASAQPTFNAAQYRASQAANAAISSASWSSAKTVAITSSVSVGGKAVSMPLSLRLAAGAGSVAARAMFSNPWTAAAMIAAPYAIEWAQSSGLFFSTDLQAWQLRENLDGTIYDCGGHTATSPMAACTAYADAWNVTYHNGPQQSSFWMKVSSCGQTACTAEMRQGSTSGYIEGYSSLGFTVGVGGGTNTERNVASADEFEELIKAKPMPWQVPNEVAAPYPVETPVINPDAYQAPSVFKLPTGDPVAVPNTNPQQYKYPQTSIKPSATTAEPLRVDITTGEVLTTDPNATTTPNPQAAASATSTPTESDLCEKYPEILACAKPDLDTPEVEIPRSEKTITYEEEQLFGEGSCPADLTHTLSNGQSLKVWDWQYACEKALPLRFLIISLATFGAFLIVMPGSTRV